MTLKRIGTWMFALAICWALAGCGGGGDSDSGTDPSNRIHVLAAESGRLIPNSVVNGTASSWTLVLQKPYPMAIWYADRPARDSGTTALKDYVQSVWPRAYGKIDPNATVHFQLTGSDELEGVYASLSGPSYDEKTDTLSFRAEILGNSVVQPTPAPLSFKAVTLNVLNNAAGTRDVASYVQYASRAVLQPTSTPGQYRLVMSGADSETLQVSNAPAQYFENRPTSEFLSQWPGLFDSNPPNAAIIGTPAAGGLRLEFLTLRDPVYDAGSGQLSYKVTLLDNTGVSMGPLSQVVLSIDTTDVSRFPAQGKGTAYQAFGRGYDPSRANSTRIYFGSDVARKQMGSLWGTRSYLSQSCESFCRDDLQKMKRMGINLVRVYDWDLRNDHSQFLDYAHSLNIKVIVPISNWLAENPQFWDEQVPQYFSRRNFGNSTGKDWHPAIAGVTISNELDMSMNKDAKYVTAIGLVERFLVEANDRRSFSKSVRVGMPVSFGAMPGQPAAWHSLDLFANSPKLKRFKDQLMLNPNTYNSREDLFGNPQTNQTGWVQKTYDRYQLPILFTEIGMNRVQRRDAPEFVKQQLQGTLEYQRAHPAVVLGAIHFMFDNKVWKQSADGAPETDTEGSYGTFRHGQVLKTMETVEDDYDFWEKGPPGSFSIDELVPTTLYAPVVEAYK